MNKVDLATAKELMGHKSIAMTLRYSHPTPEHKKQAVESVEVSLTGQDVGKSQNQATRVTNVSSRKH